MSDAQVFGLFPTPVQRFTGVLDAPLLEALRQHFRATAQQPNNSSSRLSHTRLLQPGDSPLLLEVAQRVSTLLPSFGALMFGEQMPWALKEMWVNVLDHGGHQASHNHANSFISGVLYLSECDSSARTVFMRSPGAQDFIFRNDHAGVVTGPYNAQQWISPQPEPGDMLLFPSYLLHAVPPNAGGERITLAFNAIPSRLDSWGYAVSFNG